MEKEIAILGGDLRTVKLAEMLVKDGFFVKTYALEKAEELKQIGQIQMCKSLQELVEGISIILGPIPFSKNQIHLNAPYSEKEITIEEILPDVKGKKLITGNLKKEMQEKLKEKEIEGMDLLQKEELVVLNTIATAEGAIQIAMEETDYTLHGSNILVLGFGRVGKVLANKLKAMDAKVYCEARKSEDFAWIKAYGYEPVELKNLKEKLNTFAIIFNTIPSLIIGKEELSCLKKESVIIDLASAPGGVDQMVAKELGIKTIWALALPGKVAPITSAEYIRDTIYSII